MASRRDVVSSLLGSPRALVGLEVAERIERGLPMRALDRLKAEMKLTDAEIAMTLGLSTKTIGRLRNRRRGALDPVTSDRLFRIARLYKIATEVLEDPDGAMEWLRTPQFGLNMRVPLDLLRTEAGAREIETLLRRIDYGVLA